MSPASPPLADTLADLVAHGQEALARTTEQLDVLRRLNELHRAKREEDSRLSARIESFVDLLPE